MAIQSRKFGHPVGNQAGTFTERQFITAYLLMRLISRHVITVSPATEGKLPSDIGLSTGTLDSC